MLFISDLHTPWENPKALDHCRKIRDKFKIGAKPGDRIVCLGDEIDAAAFSKYPMNPDLPGASDELEQAIEHLQPFYKEFPEVKVCASNHGGRIFKKTMVSGLPSKIFKRYEEILEYPVGWHLVDSVEMDGWIAIHGEGFNRTSWRNAHEKLRQSVVMGHQHSGAGVVYSQGRKKMMFSINSGCLIDPRRKAFDYGKNCIEKPCIGTSVVLDGEEAYFLPMLKP